MVFRKDAKHPIKYQVQQRRLMSSSVYILVCRAHVAERGGRPLRQLYGNTLTYNENL
jgi:hypothetical protein